MITGRFINPANIHLWVDSYSSAIGITKEEIVKVVNGACLSLKDTLNLLSRQSTIANNPNAMSLRRLLIGSQHGGSCTLCKKQFWTAQARGYKRDAKGNIIWGTCHWKMERIHCLSGKTKHRKFRKSKNIKDGMICSDCRRENTQCLNCKRTGFQIPRGSIGWCEPCKRPKPKQAKVV
jgi:hypothetical protein